MSANTETTGAPEGYRQCSKKACSRWTYAPGACWTCCTPKGPDSVITAAMVASDWTPPIAAPAAHVERRKGQVWSCNGGPEFVLMNREDLGSREAWNTECGSRYVGWDVAGCMTLLADATPEPAEWDRVIRAAKSPPVQEAPKAAPVCLAPRDEDLIAAEVARQHQLALSHERSAACHGSWPTKRAEGLIDRRLAADWVEDCLGDA